VLSGRDKAALDTACARSGAKGGQAVAVAGDVGKAEDAEALCRQTLEAFGRADILVNNAGITRGQSGDADERGGVGFRCSTPISRAPFLCIKAFTRPMMKQRYGRIVNVSSVVGLLGNPGQANYVASKAGVIGLTKAVAKELASRHITVNAVAPGFIETAMTAGLDPKVREALQAQIPLGRLGSPDDVAHAVAFLCSEEAGYVTGRYCRSTAG